MSYVHFTATARRLKNYIVIVLFHEYERSSTYTPQTFNLLPLLHKPFLDGPKGHFWNAEQHFHRRKGEVGLHLFGYDARSGHAMQQADSALDTDFLT